ncbi:DUF6153 family protein [Nocardia sp. NPDC051832]|uniref:DUF6153 family protein n=1 Tax=Nocardia sp. NPDC051832 TaxID=3155673 RepID=UPI003439C735
MVDQHPLLRASGATRMLAVLALLAGIVAMHAGVFTPPSHHTTITADHSQSSDRHSGVPMDAGTAPHEHSPESAAPAGTGCAGADCDSGHAGLHGCVFILTALGLALLLVLLYYVAAGSAGGPLTLPRQWRAERERPPPWTVLSLAELSILRI